MAENPNKSEEIPSAGHPAQREFFDELSLRTIALPPGCPFTILGLAIGRRAAPLEVLAAETSVEPNLSQIRAVWKRRQGGRAAPLILAVLHNEKATLCGSSGDEPATYSGDLSREISIHSVEKTDKAGSLCRLNLAVHGLEGDIRPAVTSTATTTTRTTSPGASTLTKRTETNL